MNTPMFRLDNKIALVTGAGKGLGAACAVALARAGADVAIADRPGESLEKTAAAIRKLDRRTISIEMDVRQVDQITRGVAGAEAEFGRIDILVSNAGINRPSPGIDVTEENWDDHFATNAKGGFFLAQAAARGMIQRGWGRVIFISSQSGLVGIPGQPVYCSTKGALVQLTRTLGVEWAKHGLTVNSVAPTFVETDMTRKRLQNPEFLKFVLNKIPCGKLATPEQVAAAAVFLASEEAAMVNAHTLSVDGGWTSW